MISRNPYFLLFRRTCSKLRVPYGWQCGYLCVTVMLYLAVYWNNLKIPNWLLFIIFCIFTNDICWWWFYWGIAFSVLLINKKLKGLIASWNYWVESDRQRSLLSKTHHVAFVSIKVYFKEMFFVKHLLYCCKWNQVVD